MNDNNDKDVHYSCENPVCLGLIDYEKSHYFWIESKRPCDTGVFLRQQYIILEKNSFKMRLSALKSDESQFFAVCDEDEVVVKLWRGGAPSSRATSRRFLSYGEE